MFIFYQKICNPGDNGPITHSKYIYYIFTTYICSYALICIWEQKICTYICIILALINEGNWKYADNYNYVLIKKD